MKIRFRIKHPSGYLLLQGLRLTTRNWPCLVWACVASIPFGLFVGSPLCLAIGRWIADRRFANGIAASLGHMADPAVSQTGALRRLAGNLNAGSLRDLAFHIDWKTLVHLIHRLPESVLCAMLLELAALLSLVAGTLYVYFATDPPRLALLLENSAKYFWRFLRALAMGAVFTGPLLAALLVLRHLWLAHLDRLHSAHTVFLCSAISAAVFLLLALCMLLWVDLAEVYTIRNSMLAAPRVRQGLLPALRLLLRQFLWIFPTFLLPCILALGLLAACLFLWKSLTLGNHLWAAYLAAQFGLFLLLATRFWQRGMEVALVVAVERSTTVAAVLSQMQPRTQQANSTLQANPTLQELVQKLKKEPWAKPDVAPLKTLFPEAPPPQAAPASDTPTAANSPSTAGLPAAGPPPVRPPQESLLAEHAKKTRLLEATAEEPAPASKPSEPGLDSRPGPKPVPDPKASDANKS